MQVMQQVIEAAGSIDDANLAVYFGSHTFKTVIGDVTFGKNGEWAAPRMIVTQFQNIKGNSLEQFKDPNSEVVLLPAEFRSGKLLYPYRSSGS
jgi:branched-chain amino acid transport system substrate-binding protein